MNSLAHTEINVSDIEKSALFYSKLLESLGWKKLDLNDPTVVGFEAPDKTHLFLVQTEKKFLSHIFHRKHTGLNHLAFRVDTMEEVNRVTQFLKDNNTPVLYGGAPKDYSSVYCREHYYAVFFEDPDRIKLEVVYYK